MMAENSKIEWTTHTFNPWRGCTKVSAGCANCYAETLSGRNPKTLGVWGPQGTRVVASEAMWREPVKWNREAACCCRKTLADHQHEAGCPQKDRPRVFCASLADVFEDWTDLMSASDGAVMHVCSECGAWRTMEQMCHGPNAHMPLTMADVRRRLFSLIDATPNLDWLLLTKRPENIARMMPEDSFNACVTGDCPHDNRSNCRPFRPNLWLGTSVENRSVLHRIDALRTIPAAVRFLSVEPLLEDLGTLDLTGIHWVIVGGESGPSARPCRVEWIRNIVRQCKAAGVPCFVKQLGGNPVGDERPEPTRNADGSRTITVMQVIEIHDRKGSDWNEWPDDLRVREFPAVEAAR